MHDNKITGFEIFCVLGVIIIVIICLFTSCGHTIDRNSNEREVVGTVTEKPVKSEKRLISVVESLPAENIMSPLQVTSP